MQDTIKLSDVTVVAERPMIQRKADRMIVSVEHSKLLKSRSLSNILSLIPDVDYDGEGGISILGNGVKIYENGRTVKLSGAQLKRYLSSLRGNDIKSLEILPQATAEYDAEGATAILVINRQKKHEYGLSGYVGSEYERKSRNSFSDFVGLTYSWGKLAIYGNMVLGDLRVEPRPQRTTTDVMQLLRVCRKARTKAITICRSWASTSTFLPNSI